MHKGPKMPSDLAKRAARQLLVSKLKRKKLPTIAEAHAATRPRDDVIKGFVEAALDLMRERDE